MINKNRTCFSCHLKRTGITLFLLLLAFLSVQEISAQPGDKRTPQQRKKEAEDKITEIEKQIIDFPDRLWLNESRGNALTDLFRYTEDRDERDAIAARAFAAFDKYEELTKGSADSSRTELHRLIWMSQAPDLWRSELTNAAIEAFRQSPHFEAILAAYRKSISGLERSNINGGNDQELRNIYSVVADLYLFRAQSIARMPNAVKVMYEPKLLWEDFDKAIELKKRSFDRSSSIFVVTQIYLDKGIAAYEWGDYEIALHAYQAGDEYLAEGLKACSEDTALRCDEYMRKMYVDSVSLNKAKAYLKKGDYENAITNLSYYLTKGPAYASTCRQIYLMRAQAYRKLRKIDLALADQVTASQLSDGTNCN